jgi:23S rRNA pseudouridine1911/1915/1917 synthase
MPTGKPSTKRRKSNRIDILYEDRDMIIVNKPSGLLSVPIPKTQAPNLLEIVNMALDKKGEKAITVHRIDRFTSGAVVFAKNSESHKGLVRQFLSHTPIRTYLALVRGSVTPPSGELIHYMKQVSRGFRNIVTKPDDPQGAMARLTYSTEESHKTTSLMKIRLDTGLKNQIRVQFAAIGHPMVGFTLLGTGAGSSAHRKTDQSAGRVAAGFPRAGGPLPQRIMRLHRLRKLLKIFHIRT